MTTDAAAPAFDPCDPVAVAQALIRCPSVTPEDSGALGVLEAALTPLGFACHRLRFEQEGTAPVENLYARLGTEGPNFCFAGHTDVVPPGELKGWSIDPFSAEIHNGRLYGRGAVDMKGAIAAFVAASARHLRDHGAPKGSISLLITGDEEGVAINGTKKVLGWLKEKGEKLDACVVGEPTNPKALGDMIKIGRRGSMTAFLTVFGAQGHVAYPHLADNPLPRLARMLAAITAEPLDGGTAHFQPSNLELTTIDVGNPAHNVIPAQGKATLNIRFNDSHTPDTLLAWLRERFDAVGGAYELEHFVSGDSFLTPPGPLTELVAEAAQAVTGRRPEYSTTGGTSDARFIKDFCPVVEFGLVGQTMHKVDENTTLDDLTRLTDIYGAVLGGVFDRIG
ncbi:succinyl-diaminopimelate desuccinylase [Azospirillum rugosum]|uniref:Succinyl-diaminopimelate desuccinylase n=1 Tax=Azospirillum rugosum TaxID=416170 RepID=A0ABS4SIB7_9PROT|nr:succinyl-diaminopimelate desuccinylase [Azospirillum rugosum]MBP2292314.1 succinyl-diaminopimelate desuccinylase [Azospirillum rugosum]MDQ0526073.1 succinyl-diaminopimelate desuccinylase [Azospirillum rugosum]